MSANGLSPPGTSVYSSSSMYVGDGTWDSQRNTFLLPNLQGLNFETMRYNGMGNRFRNMPGYNSIIKGHGVVAAVTFLFIVPGAIFMARFYHRNPRMALRLHIWLQIMTVLLSTAAFILGFQAVGTKRSLTNPHHGIGVALYTLVLVQAFGGCLIHRTEKGKERFKVPLRLMLHQWMGRAIAILGMIQVALGLTLYGSPKWLFIAYAIWSFLLLAAYFILTHTNQPEMGFDDRSTYITERTASTSRSHRGHGMGSLAGVGAAGAGLAALGHRSRSRSRMHSGSRREVLSSRHSSRQSDSYVENEKYGERKGGTWRDRLLGAGAAVGGIFAAKKLFGRKKQAATETGSDVSYSRPIGPSEVTQTDLSRIEEGRAPASPANDRWRRVEEREAAQAAAASSLRPGHQPSRSAASLDSFDSRTSISDERDTVHKDSHGVRDGIAALGFAGFVKHQWNKRRNKKEDAHVQALKQHEIEEERIARANSNRRKFTADGVHPPRRARPTSTLVSESDVSGTTPALSRPSIPPPPRSTTNLTHADTATAGPSTAPGHGLLSDSGSEAYISPGGGRHHRHRSTGTGPLGAGVIGAPTTSSPPVSVKVKMHNDGRHVTLRRLNEEEAAAEREARKKDRQRRNRDGSVSSLSNMDNERWRRTEAREAAQAAQAQQEQAQRAQPIPMPVPTMPGSLAGPSGGGAQNYPVPPPPPIPGSVLSSPQGTQLHGTDTDVSAFDSNRRRRRAERAQAKQAKQGGSRVEFS